MKKHSLTELKERPIIRGKIVSGSMEPLLPIGTQITIAVGEQNLKRFDIIVFQQKDILVCHFLWNYNRIVKPYLMQTRNLSNLGLDFPFSPDDYVGKVISHKLRKRDILKIVFHELFRRRS